MKPFEGAYAGRILRIDLSTGKTAVEPLPYDFRSKYIGGRGFGSRLLFDLVSPDTEPFSPENKLIFSAGALFGTPAPAASRTTCTTKSPLSGLHGDAHSGGFFGGYMKSAGYDVLIIEGKADHPVYLWIFDDKVEIKDARHIWGKTIQSTEEAIRGELGGSDVQIASIGPAGEHLVRYASIMNGSAAFARCGVGAVMGSKNLKAIAIVGTRPIKIGDPEGLKRTMRRYWDVIKVDPYCPPAAKYGTPRFMMHRVKFGIHGANNWRYGEFNWQPLSPDVFRERHTIKAMSCPNCLMMCRRDMMIKDGPFKNTWAKVEWETIARSMTMGVDDAEGVIRVAAALNSLGLDCESTGNTIAWAMECFEKGILTLDDIGGLPMAFGNVTGILQVLDLIAHRKSIGDLLAEGTRIASRKVGRGSELFACNVKGVEMTAGDPRGMPVRAASYATSTRGSDHLRSNPYVEEIITPEEADQWFGSEEAADLKGITGKGRLLKFSEDLVTIADILGLCKFAYYRSASMKYLYEKGAVLAAALFNNCSGANLTPEEMLQRGEVTFNIEKCFNAREGATRADDVIPSRFFEEPIIGGVSAGATVEMDKFERVLDEYYEARGWDVHTSVPRRKKLSELGLDDVYENMSQSPKIAAQ